GDVTLDIYGWEKAAKSFDTIYKNKIESGSLSANSPMVCNKRWGAHIEYYFCRPLGIHMIGLGEMDELHEYMWMNTARKDKVDFSKAWCVVNSDDYYDVQAAYKKYYEKIDTVAVIPITRGNKPAHNFFVFRLSEWK